MCTRHPINRTSVQYSGMLSRGSTTPRKRDAMPEPRRLAPSVFSLARGTQLARRRHRLIERRRRAQKGVWSAYPFAKWDHVTEERPVSLPPW